jgi:rubrerythrin
MTSLIEQAIHLETTAEESYRNAAQATGDLSAGKILALLADEEAQHALMLRTMTDVSDIEVPDLLQSAKTWIRGVVEGGALAISPDAGLLDILQRAMTIEQTTESFYREHAETAEEDSVRKMFTKLANTEQTHYVLVGSLVEYFNRPSEWVESAEFGERDEY